MDEIKTTDKNIDEHRSSAAKMGEMPMLRLILSMSLPSMFSMLIQACYNIVDSIYVSWLGEYALSALSIIFPIQMLYIAVAVGASVGLSSLISRRLGERRIEEAYSAAQHGLLLAAVHSLIFIAWGIFGIRRFCAAFADSTQIFDASVSYGTIVCIGSVLVMASCSYERVMQAGGNMTAPMWSLLAGAVTNIILDPIMIFGYFGCPALGTAGAAYATVIGEAVGLTVSNILMHIKPMPVKIRFKPFRINTRIIKDIYVVGFPSMIMQAIGSVTILALNAMLIRFSSTAVAVYGVYFKLQSFVLMPVFGINHGLLPIMGYNFGAKNYARLMQALKYGIIIAFVIMTGGMLVFKIFPAQLMGLFKAEEDLSSIGIQCLTTISWCFPVAAVCIIIGTLFQATGKGFYSLIVSVMRQLVVIVPAAYIFSKLFGLAGIWWAYPCAELVSLSVTLVLYGRLKKTALL